MAVKSRLWGDSDHLYLQVTTEVRVSPETAFDYVSDVTRHPEWTTNPLDVTPLSAEPPHVGSKYRTVAQSFGRGWESLVEIIALERPRRFEFTSVGGITHEPEAEPHRHEYTFVPIPGGTRIEVLRRSRPISRRSPRQRIVVWLISTGNRLPAFAARSPAARALERIRRNLEATIAHT